MGETAHNSSSVEATNPSKRRRWRVALPIVVALAVVAGMALPRIVAPLAASSIRDALRDGLPPSATVEVDVALGWISPTTATVGVRDGESVRATLEVSTPRGLGGWIVPGLGGSLGEVPVSFAVEGRLAGESGRTLLDRLGMRGGESGRASGEVGGRGGSAAVNGVLDGLSILASGSIDLEVVDPIRGIDVAIASDRAELALREDRSLSALLELRIGRAGDVAQTAGRMRVDASLANGIEPSGAFEAAAATGRIEIAASSIEFEWERSAVLVASLDAAAHLDREAGVALAFVGAGSVDGRGAVLETDLKWRIPFDERGALRSDFNGVSGDGHLSGLPLAALAGSLPAPAADLLVDLGTSLEAEWSLPVEGDLLNVAARTEHATLAATARLEREFGRLVDGSVRLDAMLTSPPSDGEVPADSKRIPATVAVAGLEYRDGELEVATASVRLEDAHAALIDMFDGGDALAVLAEAPLGLTANSIRWRIADGVQAIEARGRLDSDAVLRAGGLDGRLVCTLSRVGVEWFAEPLGRALSIRGDVGLDDGTVRFDERLDGLWTGDAWLPASSLRPHGTASVDGIDLGVLSPFLPEEMQRAWTRQSRGRVDVQLSTRVEGDRLEGVLRAIGPNLDLRMPLSVDAQRIALGPAEASVAIVREAIEALPDSWTRGVEIADDLRASVAVEPVLLPIDILSGRPTAPPAFVARAVLSRVPIAAAPGLASGATFDLRDLRCRIGRADDGAVVLEGDARLSATDPADALGEFHLELASSSDGRISTRVDLSSFDAAAIVPMLAFAEGSVLEPPAGRDWLGRLEVGLSAGTDDPPSVTVRGERLEIDLSMASPVADSPDDELVVESIEFEASLPPEALVALSGEALAALRPTSDVRLRGRGAGVAIDSGGSPRGEIAVETDPIEMSSGVGDEVKIVSFAGHRIALTILPGPEDQRDVAIRLGPMQGRADGATVGFDGRVSRESIEGGWRLDGGGGVRGIPTMLLDGLVGDDTLLADVLGTPFDATFTCASLGVAEGRLRGDATFPNGRFDLPVLRVERDVLRIPTEEAFTAELVFGAGAARLLEDLSPLLGSVESLEQPVRLAFAGGVVPRAGADRELLSGDLRVDVGRGRFKPRGVLRAALVAAGDSNAEGFAGEVSPLLATIRDGRLVYRDFAVGFVPYGGGWRNTIVGDGEIDLAVEPALGTFTMAFPATSLAAYSSEVRRILETRPQLLGDLALPLTLRGPLDGSAPLEVSIEFEPERLLEAGVETLIEEGFRRLFDRR